MTGIPKTAQEEFKDLKQTQHDGRCYRLVVLPNKLEVLLVHEARVSSAAFTLSVNVGMYHQEHGRFGISEVVAHVLKNSAKGNAHSTMRKANFNTYVSSSRTEYVVELSYPAHTAALNKTSSHDTPFRRLLEYAGQTFTSPIFLEDDVHSAFKYIDGIKKKELGDRSLNRLMLQFLQGNPEHPAHQLARAREQPLCDIPSNEMLEMVNLFWSSQYSANQMKLVILACESLDVLENEVRATFHHIPNLDLPKPFRGIPLYTQTELLTQTSVETTAELIALALIFPFHDEEAFESKSTQYVTSIIHRECPGSLSVYLKASGWVSRQPDAMAQRTTSGAGNFTIRVELTSEGLLNYQEVIKAIFQYVSMAARQGPQQSIIAELTRGGGRHFCHLQKLSPPDLTYHLATMMQHTSDRTSLHMNLTTGHGFDVKFISRILSFLRPDNLILELSGKDILDGSRETTTWRGLAYQTVKLTSDFVRSLREAFDSPDGPSEMHLNFCNDLVPRRWDLKRPLDLGLGVQQLLNKHRKAKIWWKTDVDLRDEARVCLRFTPTLHSFTVAEATLAVKLLSQLVSRVIYGAEIAGFRYSWTYTQYCLIMKAEGPADTIRVLLEKMLLASRGTEVQDQQINSLRDSLGDELRRTWRNCEVAVQALSYLKSCIDAREADYESLLAALHSLTTERIREFQSLILDESHVEIFALGNLIEEDVLEIAKAVPTALIPTPLTQQPPMWSPGSNVRLLKQSNTDGLRNCVAYALYIGLANDGHIRAQLYLAQRLLSESCMQYFSDAVSGAYRAGTGEWLTGLSEGWGGCYLIIESERASELMENDIEDFLASFKMRLRSMNAVAIRRHIDVLLCETDKGSEEVHSSVYDFFGQRAGAAKHFSENTLKTDLTALDKSDIESFYSRFFTSDSPDRAKLSVHIQA